MTPWLHTSHQRTCSLPCSPSALPNLHHLPSPRKSALEGSFPTNCATFPGHRQALQPSSNRARCGADSGCLCVRCYQQHALTRPYNRPPTHTTPLHHEQPVPSALLGFVSAASEDRATLHMHLNHSINTPQTPNPHTPWQSIHKRLGRRYGCMDIDGYGVTIDAWIWCEQP